VRIRADESVGIGGLGRVGLGLAGPHGLRQELEVDLVADAGAGRYDGEILERRLAPLEEAVALPIAGIFELDVPRDGARRAELVDDDRMVDDEVDRHERVDLARIAAERLHGVPHRRKVDDGGNPGEVLHQHARRPVRDLLLGLAAVVEKGRERLDVGPGDRAAVLVAQQVLQEHLHREGQPRDAGKSVLLGIRD
jgi:hypothetical protein